MIPTLTPGNTKELFEEVAEKFAAAKEAALNLSHAIANSGCDTEDTYAANRIYHLAEEAGNSEKYLLTWPIGGLSVILFAKKKR